MSHQSGTLQIVRPNGKTYRARKPGLAAHAWENDYEGGVIVFGTLDPDTARPLAEDACHRWFGANAVTDASPGWFRNGFHCGDRRWFIDTEKGRPGVSFQAADA